MLEGIKAVIFDMDGTLIDSMWLWEDVDRDYLHSVNVEMPDDLQECLGGMSMYESAIYFKDRFDIKDSIEDIINTWNRMAYDKYSKEVPLKEGALDFLKYIKDKGLKLGVATSNSYVLAKAALEHLGVFDMFDSVLTGEKAGAGKPEPDIYINSAKVLDVSPRRCLAFEDVPAGLMAARNATMRVCAVYDEYSAEDDDIKREIADYYIKSYKDIFDKTYEVL